MGGVENRNKRLASLAVAGALTFSAGACEGADTGTGSNEATAPDPLVSIQAQLDEQEAGDLFEVDTEEGTYWRLHTLDLFDGSTWSSSDPDGSKRGVWYTSPAQVPAEPAPVGAQSRSYVFRVLNDIRASWLPMPDRPESINVTDGEVTYDPFLAQALVEGGLDGGFEYSVKARVAVPTAAELDAVSAEFLTPDQYGVWTSLPDSLDPRIEEIARAWTEDEPNAYRKVLAIQQRFQGGDFAYDTAVEPPADIDALVEFLTETKTGFCSHYASAMAVMVRAVGLPARIAVGYRSGTQQEDGSYLVQTDDSHVWVEVLFPDYGWLPFEPEHGATHPNAEAGTYLNP